MSSTPRYAHIDTKQRDGFYVQFKRVIEQDDSGIAPDEKDEGFWPSRDTTDAGYCPPEQFDASLKAATERMDAWKRDEWTYVGVRARALCVIVRNGVGNCINLDSAGTWGVESDCEEYIETLYQEQIEELKVLIAAMTNPTYE